jgi:hypothetical protein
MLQSSYEILEIEAPVLPELRLVMTLCTAEVAECTCPDWCERDHDTD